MEKWEYRAVMKFFQLKGKTPTEIKAELDSVYGNTAPSFTTAKFWAAEFKRSRRSIYDKECSGWSKTVTTDEMIDYVHEIVNNDRRLILKELAEAAGLSTNRCVFNCSLKSTVVEHFTNMS